MSESIAIHPLARPCRITAICVRYESKALRTTSLPVLRKEDTSDAAEALKHLAQVCFFGELRDLYEISKKLGLKYRMHQLTLVTLSVARSSLSPYLPPIFSPAPPAPLFRKCGGT